MAVALTIRPENICNTLAIRPIKYTPSSSVFVFTPVSVLYSIKVVPTEGKTYRKQFDLWEELVNFIREADYKSLTFAGYSYYFGFTSPIIFQLCDKEGTECKINIEVGMTTYAQYSKTREKFIKEIGDFRESLFKHTEPHDLPESMLVDCQGIDDFYLVYPLRQDELGEIDYYNVKLPKFKVGDIVVYKEERESTFEVAKLIGFDKVSWRLDNKVEVDIEDIQLANQEEINRHFGITLVDDHSTNDSWLNKIRKWWS